MKRCAVGRVISNERISGPFLLMRIEAGPVARDCRPGEFIHLRGLTTGWPYLRRPFSIYSTDGEDCIEILYKVVGRATSLMAEMLPGDSLDIMGPLGTAFDIPREIVKVIAIGGGTGIPPLVFFCRKYAGVLDRIELLAGAMTASELVVPVGLLAEGIGITRYTDDGSKGTKGLVTEGLPAAIARMAGSSAGGLGVIACGPRDMLKAAAGIAAEAGLFCQVSVEEIMACGVGACLSCAVPSAGGGYLHACKDGPVMDASRIDWERWA
jgi:dihydroorotate dehydrogenase electron transfer subunit